MDINIDLKANTSQANKSLGAFQNQISKVNQSLTNVTKDANRASDGFKGMGMAFSGSSTMLQVGALYGLANALSGCIKGSLDMIETVNLFNVSMGEMAEATDKVVTGMSDITGLDLNNLRSGVGTFGILARSMGMAGEQAQTLSVNTSKMALDLSSLMNVPINQVMADLRSGLVGQSETVYKYGIDVTEAGLKAEAMAQGISKSVRDMSQGEKMALRYSAMIRQTALAQGDFANTINSPANQLRILHERFVTLARAIGNIFIPMLEAILPYINAVVMALTWLANKISAFFGFKQDKVKNTTNGFSNMGGAIDNVGKSAGGASKDLDKMSKKAKEAKNNLLGIDEINILPKDSNDDTGSSGGSGGGGIGDGDMGSILGDMQLPSYDNLFGNIKSKADEILAKMVALKDTIMGFVNQVIEFAQRMYNLFAPTFIEAFNIIAPSLIQFSGLVQQIFLDLLDLGGKLATWLGNDFVINIQNTIIFVSKILSGLLDTVRQVMSDIWNLFVLPLLNKFITEGLPLLSDAYNKMLELTDNLFFNLKDIFDKVWTEGARPLLMQLTKMFIDIADSIIKFYKDYAEPIFNKLCETFNNTSQYLINIWNQWLKPMWDKFMETVDWLWTNHLKPLMDKLLDFAGSFIECALTILNKFVIPICNYFVDILSPAIKWAWNTIMDTIAYALSFISDLIGGLLDILSGLCKFVTGVLTGDWNRAWQGMKQVFQGVWNSLEGIARGVGNGIITCLNAVIGGIESALNVGIRAVNKLGKLWNEAKGALGISGGSISAIGELNFGRIPRLARGGIVPSGAIFQAGEFGKSEMMGSYNGNTTVMPLENTDFVKAMYSAVYNAVSDSMKTGNGGDVVLKVGETELGRATINGINKVTRQEGKLMLNI